jgi:hypothetical protein
MAVYSGHPSCNERLRAFSKGCKKDYALGH